MNKEQFAGAIAAEVGLSKAAVIRVLDSARNLSSSVIRDGGEVKLKGWMTITRVDVPERSGRNPRTGERITVAAHYRPKFRPHEGFGQ